MELGTPPKEQSSQGDSNFYAHGRYNLRELLTQLTKPHRESPPPPPPLAPPSSATPCPPPLAAAPSTWNARTRTAHGCATRAPRKARSQGRARGKPWKGSMQKDGEPLPNQNRYHRTAWP